MGGKGRVGTTTYMFTKGVIVGVFDFVKVVFVQLAHEAGEIRVLEHAG